MTTHDVCGLFLFLFWVRCSHFWRRVHSRVHVCSRSSADISTFLGLRTHMPPKTHRLWLSQLNGMGRTRSVSVTPMAFPGRRHLLVARSTKFRTQATTQFPTGQRSFSVQGSLIFCVFTRDYLRNCAMAAGHCQHVPARLVCVCV